VRHSLTTAYEESPTRTTRQLATNRRPLPILGSHMLDSSREMGVCIGSGLDALERTSISNATPPQIATCPDDGPCRESARSLCRSNRLVVADGAVHVYRPAIGCGLAPR